MRSKLTWSIRTTFYCYLKQVTASKVVAGLPLNQKSSIMLWIRLLSYKICQDNSRYFYYHLSKERKNQANIEKINRKLMYVEITKNTSIKVVVIPKKFQFCLASKCYQTELNWFYQNADHTEFIKTEANI